MIKYINEGYNIVCDRYIVSSLAYQGYAQGIGKDRIYEFNRATVDLLEKNAVPIYCFKSCISESNWKKRKAERLQKENADSIEQKDIHDKVFEFYNSFYIYYTFTHGLNMFTHNVDSNGSIEEIHKYVLDKMNILLK